MAPKILAIDHQLNTEGYLYLGQHLSSCHDLEICNSLKDAYCILFDYKPQNFFDLVILNWQMPPFAEKNICNVAVLAKQIRTKLPNTKIIVMSRFWQPSQLKDIINSCKPERIFEKCDLCSQNIPIYVSQVLKGEIIRTPTIIEYLQIIHRNDINFDEYDRQILFYLSSGYQTKDLEPLVYFSVSAIKKRKQKMKEHFNMGGCSDIDLISIAKQKKVI